MEIIPIPLADNSNKLDTDELKLNYVVPNNDNLKLIFKKIFGTDSISVTHRKTIDKNSFSFVEKLTLSNGTNYVLKTVSDIMQGEVLVHKFVNSYRINAPYFFYGSVKSDKHKYNYIIMEYLEDYLHLYNILEDELYFEAVRSIGELHLNSMQRMDTLKKLQIPEYSVQWYIDNVNRIIFDISRYSIQQTASISSSPLLPKNLIADLNHKIPKIREYLQEIVDIPLTLVHGDFDSGNIIFYKKGTHAGSVKAIDWGHGHISSPLIDIAHLVNSLGYVDYDTKIRLISEYLRSCRPIYDQNVPFTYLIIGGTILHYLYHLNFKIKAIKEGYVEGNFFREQIHNRVTQLLQILV